MFEPTESLESENAAPESAEVRAPEPLFSELIDRWLLEGDRLDEEARPAGETPPSPPETWRTRAVELGDRILQKHRLEVLVGVGLVPLMLFLVTQGSGRRDAASAAPPVRPPARVTVATVTPRRGAPVAMVSVPENPRVRAAPKPAVQQHELLAHRAAHPASAPKPAPPKLASQKPAPPKLVSQKSASPKLASQKTAPQKPAAQKPAPPKVALHKQAAPQPAPPHRTAPKPVPPAPAQAKKT